MNYGDHLKLADKNRKRRRNGLKMEKTVDLSGERGCLENELLGRNCFTTKFNHFYNV